MDTRFLETLISVAEAGSMAEAARRQGLTPAAVNQRVRTLERDLGAALFQRAGKTVVPTAACCRVLEQAKDLVSSARHLRDCADEEGLSGDLNFGAIATVMAEVMPRALVRLRDRAPQLRANLRPGTSPQLYDMLLSGEIDAALIIEPPFELPKSLTAIRVKNEPLNIIYPVHMKQSPDALLRTQPYIQYDPNSWGGALAEKFVRDRGIVPNVFCTMDDIHTTRLMVEAGVGVSLIPAQPWMADTGGRLQVTSVADNRYSRNLVFAHRAVSFRKPAVEAMLDEVRQLLQE